MIDWLIHSMSTRYLLLMSYILIKITASLTTYSSWASAFMVLCLLVTARPERHGARGWKEQISRPTACLMRVFSFDQENMEHKPRQDLNVGPNLNPHTFSHRKRCTFISQVVFDFFCSFILIRSLIQAYCQFSQI